MEIQSPKRRFTIDSLGDQRVMVQFSVANSKLQGLGNLRILGRWMDSADKQAELGVHNYPKSERTVLSLDVPMVIKDQFLGMKFLLTSDNIRDVDLVVEEGKIKIVLSVLFGLQDLEMSYVFDVADYQAEPSFDKPAAKVEFDRLFEKTRSDYESGTSRISREVKASVVVALVAAAISLLIGLGLQSCEGEVYANESGSSSGGAATKKLEE